MKQYTKHHQNPEIVSSALVVVVLLAALVGPGRGLDIRVGYVEDSPGWNAESQQRVETAKELSLRAGNSVSISQLVLASRDDDVDTARETLGLDGDLLRVDGNNSIGEAVQKVGVDLTVGVVLELELDGLARVKLAGVGERGESSDREGRVGLRARSDELSRQGVDLENSRDNEHSAR